MPPGKLTRLERIRKHARFRDSSRIYTPLARYRDRDLRVTISGTYTLGTNPPVFSSASVGVQEECQDYLYNFDKVNPLSLYKRESRYPVLRGYRLNNLGQVIRSFADFPVGYRPGAPDPRTANPALLPTEISDLAWQTLAATNPNSPHVEVPSFFGELKDLLTLFKGSLADLRKLRKVYSAPSLVRQTAQGNIAQRWVLQPLWSDMQKLLTFQRAVNQRAQMLHNLQCGKEMRKRVKLRHRVTTGTPSNVTIHSTGAIFSGKTRVDSSERVWGTATWKIAGSTRLPKLSWPEFKDSRQRGFLENEKFLNGLAAGTADISHEVLVTAWELMPWSWLIDWCTNYGEILRATRNAIPVTWSKVAIMRETKSYRHFYDIGTDSSWSVLTRHGNYFEEGTRKERFRPVLLPFSLPCFIPLLEADHVAILASLALASGRLPGVK